MTLEIPLDRRLIEVHGTVPVGATVELSGDEHGEVVDELTCGERMVTNSCFGDTDLYVTESRHGTLWRFPVGRRGLPLPYGS